MKRNAIATWVAVLLVVVLAAIAFASITRGFSAITSEGARRIDLQQSPRELPSIELIDQSGSTMSLADYGTASGYATFVTLMYVRCQTICRSSASGQAFLQNEILQRGLQGKLRLLTLSFDPSNDTPAVLAEYGKGLGADAAIWRLATVSNPASLAVMLKVFDIVVIPDGLGGYSHNAALFFIGSDGRLAKAYDIDRPDLALRDYLRRTGTR